MKRSSTVFLKGVILLSAISVIAALIWFPQTEGRATNLDLVSIYSDPLIIYVYFASIPFFIGLFQAFKLLNFIETNTAFSQGAVNTLKIMKVASITLIAFIVMALAYIRFFVKGEDSAGPTMLGMLVSLTFGIIAAAAGVFQRVLENAAGIKSENDLTV